MRIAICEDNKTTAAEVENVLAQLRLKNLEWDVFYDGVELLEYLDEENAGYQLYLMDIQMPLTDGIKTAKRIREMDKNTVIVFMTDYTEFVYDVFEALPFRFLQKPVTGEKLKETVCDALDYLNTMKKYLSFTVNNSRMQVACDEILYVESDRRKIRLYTADGMYEFYGKLSEVESSLDANIFMRIHASYLISLSRIRRVVKEEVELDNGVRLPVSKKYRDTVKERQINFVKWRNGI